MPDDKETPIEFEADHEYHISLSGTISAKGRNEIARLIDAEYGASFLWEDMGGFELVNDDGKVTTRIRNNLYKRLGLKLDGPAISQIGNIAHNNTVDNGQYAFAISTDMNVWTNEHSGIGDGNRGSCFQPGGEYHQCWRAMDSNPSCYVMLLSRVEDDEVQPTYARCWVWHRSVSDDLILFNSYGESLNRMGIIMAQALKLRTTQGRLGDRGGFYMNSGRVNIVGRSPQFEERIHMFSVSDWADNYDECSNCGRDIRIGWDDHDVVSGELLCINCYFNCAGCHASCHIDHAEGGRFYSYDYCLECIEEDQDLPACQTCHERFDPAEDGFAMALLFSNTVFRCGQHCSRCVVCETPIQTGQRTCDQHQNVQPELNINLEATTASTD